MERDTIGDIMAADRRQAWKRLAAAISVIVYGAMLFYTAAHNINLMALGVPRGFFLWALLGIVAMELSAIALPVALHWWFFSPMQRLIGVLFYVLDLSVLWANTVLDWHMVRGDFASLPWWLAAYFTFVMPATPLMAGGLWSLLWLLDPSHQEHAMRETLRAATHRAMMDRLAIEARAREVNNLVDASARQVAREVVAKTVNAISMNGHRPLKEGSIPIRGRRIRRRRSGRRKPMDVG